MEVRRRGGLLGLAGGSVGFVYEMVVKTDMVKRCTRHIALFSTFRQFFILSVIGISMHHASSLSPELGEKRGSILISVEHGILFCYHLSPRKGFSSCLLSRDVRGGAVWGEGGRGWVYSLLNRAVRDESDEMVRAGRLWLTEQGRYITSFCPESIKFSRLYFPVPGS